MPTVDELYPITNTNADVTGANGTAAVWSDVYSYKVPAGFKHVLLPTHAFKFSGYDTAGTPAVLADTDQIMIEVRDAAGVDGSKDVIYRGLYVHSKEFQDRDKIARLQVPGYVEVDEGWFIVIRVKSAVAMDFDHANSYFVLETQRIRQTVRRAA